MVGVARFINTRNRGRSTQTPSSRPIAAAIAPRAAFEVIDGNSIWSDRSGERNGHAGMGEAANDNGFGPEIITRVIDVIAVGRYAGAEEAGGRTPQNRAVLSEFHQSGPLLGSREHIEGVVRAVGQRLHEFAHFDREARIKRCSRVSVRRREQGVADSALVDHFYLVVQRFPGISTRGVNRSTVIIAAIPNQRHRTGLLRRLSKQRADKMAAWSRKHRHLSSRHTAS